jgi:hypothetical protein
VESSECQTGLSKKVISILCKSLIRRTFWLKTACLSKAPEKTTCQPEWILIYRITVALLPPEPRPVLKRRVMASLAAVRGQINLRYHTTFMTFLLLSRKLRSEVGQPSLVHEKENQTYPCRKRMRSGCSLYRADVEARLHCPEPSRLGFLLGLTGACEKTRHQIEQPSHVAFRERHPVQIGLSEKRFDIPWALGRKCGILNS